MDQSIRIELGSNAVRRDVHFDSSSCSSRCVGRLLPVGAQNWPILTSGRTLGRGVGTAVGDSAGTGSMPCIDTGDGTPQNAGGSKAADDRSRRSPSPIVSECQKY